ncbi:hypothetical protein RhiTH_008154 [Rhizoctonia solani]
MEPELSLAALLKAVTALTVTIGSLLDQIRNQGQQLAELKAICKETANLVGDKDQGGAQTKPGPLTGHITPPTHLGGEAHTPGMVRPGCHNSAWTYGTRGLKVCGPITNGL